jgi:hypothetical protein
MLGGAYPLYLRCVYPRYFSVPRIVAEKKGGIKSPVPMIMADRKEKCFSHPGNKIQKNPENTMRPYRCGM